jgi:CRISPR type III-B/RAMP module RAMP protein Cmr6
MKVLNEVREVLQNNPLNLSNRSLLFDKYLDPYPSSDPNQRKEDILNPLVGFNNNNPKLTLLRREGYKAFINIFKSHYVENAILIDATLESRMVLNMSSGLQENSGIQLDKRFGMPQIYGSSVKGAVRNAAYWDIKSEPNNEKKLSKIRKFCSIFGYARRDFEEGKELSCLLPENADILNLMPYDECKGKVSFLDATCKEARIVLDLNAPHYGDYYRSGNIADLKRESPQVLPFPCVEKGGKFTFIFLCKEDLSNGHTEQLKKWTQQALEIGGIGGKIASGFGWFSIDGKDTSNGDESKKETLSDYNDVSFTNAVIEPAKNPGMFENLRKQIPILQKPENKEWVVKFKEQLKGSSFKNSRKKLKTKDWFPKEWLEQ